MMFPACPNPRQFTHYHVPCPVVFLISWTFAAWLVFSIFASRQHAWREGVMIIGLSGGAGVSSEGLLKAASDHPGLTLPSDGPEPSSLCDVFVGIQTAAISELDAQHNYAARRSAIRHSWLPDCATYSREAVSITCRFVIGLYPGAEVSSPQLHSELAAHDDFLKLPLDDSYRTLPKKSLFFFRHVSKHYNPRYIIKVDDDVYLQVPRLLAAAEQWASKEIDYTGCMKQGQVTRDAHMKWYEPQHALLSDSYFTHSWGSMYALSGRAAKLLTLLPAQALRRFENEDVTIGSWMLALTARHLDDRRLCSPECTNTSVAVWDYPLPTAHLPVQRIMHHHSQPLCRSTAIEAPSLGMLPQLFQFLEGS